LQLHYAAGDYFGEIGVFSGQPRTITASAHCYCVLSSLSKAIFDTLQQEKPDVFVTLLKTVQNTLASEVHVTWQQLAAILLSHFGDKEAAFQALLPKSRNSLLHGVSQVIPLQRFITSITKLGVPVVDARLLWLDIDFMPAEDDTVLSKESFFRTLPDVPKEELERIMDRFHRQFLSSSPSYSSFQESTDFFSSERRPTRSRSPDSSLNTSNQRVRTTIT